jgi:sec-independent protein translocase protein TatB
MFGMGFTEILFIAVVAILFLGPDKLPDAMVQIAKLFKSIKSTVNEAKRSFEDEVNIKELREEALGYRKQFENVSDDISGFKNSIPNPAAELKNAVTSIGGDRYLDDDILADIEEAQSKSQDTITSEALKDEDTDQQTTEEKPADKVQKQSRKKTPKKSAGKPDKKSKTTAKKGKKTNSGEKA